MTAPWLPMPASIAALMANGHHDQAAELVASLNPSVPAASVRVISECVGSIETELVDLYIGYYLWLPMFHMHEEGVPDDLLATYRAVADSTRQHAVRYNRLVSFFTWDEDQADLDAQERGIREVARKLVPYLRGSARRLVECYGRGESILASVGKTDEIPLTVCRLLLGEWSPYWMKAARPPRDLPLLRAIREGPNPLNK